MGPGILARFMVGARAAWWVGGILTTWWTVDKAMDWVRKWLNNYALDRSEEAIRDAESLLRRRALENDAARSIPLTPGMAPTPGGPGTLSPGDITDVMDMIRDKYKLKTKTITPPSGGVTPPTGGSTPSSGGTSKGTTTPVSWVEAESRELERQSQNDILVKPTLKRGARGPHVSDLQTRLNIVGSGEVITVDGIFGPKTEARVRDFQADFELKVDGIVGAQTWNKLYELTPSARLTVV